MEHDDEVNNVEGSSYTAEYWQYDGRLGRRWNIDPVVKLYESPYATFSDSPIWFADQNGLDPTVYENADNGEKIEIHDGIDRTIEVNATDFQEVKFFKNELDNNNNDWKSLYSFDILEAYREFYNNHVYYNGYSLSNIYAYFTETPFENWATSNVQGGPGILEYIGGPVAYEEKQASKIVGKVVVESLETQSHHIIPKAIYKKYAAKLAPYLKLNAEFNLKNLPVPFHGNHPQYNKFVGNQIEKLIQSGNLNATTLRGLQEDLTKLINKAYDSGEKLNDYFRNFN